HVSIFVALLAALSMMPNASASTGVVLPVPAPMSAPHADQMPALRFAHVNFFRTFDAALSTRGSSSASTGVVLLLAAWVAGAMTLTSPLVAAEMPSMVTAAAS